MAKYPDTSDEQDKIIVDNLPQIRQYYLEFGRGLTVIVPDSTGTKMERMTYIPLDRWDEVAPQVSAEVATDAHTRRRVATYNEAAEVLVLMALPKGAALIAKPLSLGDGLGASLMMSLHNKRRRSRGRK